MIPSRVQRVFERGGFIRAVGMLVSASVLGHLILFAAMPIVTRLYTPSDFGLFAVFTALFGLVLVASSLRYELAIPLPRTDGHASVLLQFSLLTNSLVAIISALVIVPFGKLLSSTLNSPGLASVLWLLPICIFGAGSYRAFRFWAVRRHDFEAIARTKVGQAVANAAFQIGCGLTGLGAAGLAIAHFFSLSVGAFKLAHGTGAALRKWNRWQLLRVLALTKRYIRFPMLDAPAAFINALSTQLPNLLLAVLFAPVIAGFYLLADRALGLPLTLLSQSISHVLYAGSRKAVEDGNIGALAMRVLVGFSMVLMLPITIIFFAGEPLFALVFGETWREAGVYASWLALGFFGQSLYASVSLLLLATNAQNINLIFQFVMLALRGAALLFGYTMANALVAVISICFVDILGHLIATFVVIRHARHFGSWGRVETNEQRVGYGTVVEKR